MTNPTRTCAECSTGISHRGAGARRCESCQRTRELEALKTKKRTMYDHVCEWCGKAFRNRVKGSRFCSVKCSGDYSHPGDVDRICVVCDEPFTISKQYDRDTCSRPCRKWSREHPGEKPIRECIRCGAALTGKHLDAVYCSATCSVAVRAFVLGKAKTISRRPDGCIICGASLEGRTHRRRYCSHACQALISHERRSRKISNAPVERVLPADIFKRDAWICHLCDGSIDRTLRNKHPLMASLDHVIPINELDYPGHVWENLATAHLRCNIRKGHKATDRDWKLYRELVSRRP